MSPKKEPITNFRRLRVLFKGRVQGVGFRHTVEGFGQDMGITGWVMNLPSGEVEVVAEGSEAKLQAFLKHIQESHLGTGITRHTVQWSESQNEFDDFRVEYYI